MKNKNYSNLAFLAALCFFLSYLFSRDGINLGLTGIWVAIGSIYLIKDNSRKK